LSIIETHSISAPETRALRHSVLRPHRPLSECVYPYDTAPDALHIGCFLNEQLIGVGSILPDPRKDASQPTNWRIRGMAVQEEMRGSGMGGKILQALIDHASAQSLPAEIWCHARANARSFYIRFGFTQESDLFEVPYLGPYVLMVKTLHPIR
jgi:predicted GNAT family N-acyltransferase